MSENEYTKLSDLRVVELKSELEKRGLEKNGVKQILVERLQKAMDSAGEDVTQFLNAKKKKVSEQTETKDSLSPPKKQLNVTEVKENKNEGDGSNENEASSEEEEEAVEEGDGEEEEEDVEEKEEINTSNGDNKEEEVDEEDKTVDDVKELPQNEKKSVNAKDKPPMSAESSLSEGTTKEQKEQTKSGLSAKGSRDRKETLTNPRAIWVSNVPMKTRACEIKQKLSAYGKVVGAKVVVNAKFPGTCCFAYVTMGTAADVTKVIENLDNTELNGQIIKIEKFDIVRNEQLKQLRNEQASGSQQSTATETSSSSEKAESKDAESNSAASSQNETETKQDSKTEEVKSESQSEETATNSDAKDNAETESKELGPVDDDANSEKLTQKGDLKENNSEITETNKKKSDKSSSERKASQDDSRKKVLTFDQIKDAREKQRQKDKECLLREEARRRRENDARLRNIELKQKQEARRLEREREELRREREKIQREKHELIRLEKERQRVEREKLKMEKLELDKARQRLEEESRKAVKRTAAPFRREEPEIESRKRPALMEAPPYEPSTRSYEPPKKYVSRAREYEQRGHPAAARRPREVTPPPPPPMPRPAKEVRYERERGRSDHFREDRRSPLEKQPRFEGRSIPPGNSWMQPPKPSHSSSSRPPWSTTNTVTERLQSNRSFMQAYNTVSNMLSGSSCPPPPGIGSYSDHYNYNHMSNQGRKY